MPHPSTRTWNFYETLACEQALELGVSGFCWGGGGGEREKNEMRMSGIFVILTGETLVWPDDLTTNNLKQNPKFHTVGHGWDSTVKCLVVPNIRHNVQ